MARVLVLDDEPDYCRYVGLALQADGHELLSVSTAREAIDRGSRFLPQVLIADWMLKSQSHGINVAYALQVVEPDLRVVLITGFPSRDVQAEAARANVFRLVEKPFLLDDIRQALQGALAARRVRTPRWLQLAVVCVDDALQIRMANAKARELFSATRGEPDARRLEALLSGDVPRAVREAAERWIGVGLQSDEPSTCYIRSQTPRSDGTRLVVLRRSNEPYYAGLQAVETLLNVREPRPTRWPFEGRVLVIDADEAARGVLVAALEYAGAGCFGFESLEAGWPLFEADAGIRYVIWRLSQPESRMRTHIERMRSVRAGVTIIGASSDYRLDDLNAAGVDYCIMKPWLIDELIATLQNA